MPIYYLSFLIFVLFCCLIFKGEKFFLILSVIGAFSAYFTTKNYGAFLSPDAVNYISAARSLMSGDGYMAPVIGIPYIHWPPLFPAILAFLGFLGLDPLDGASYFNSIVFGAIIFFSGKLFEKNIE